MSKAIAKRKRKRWPADKYWTEHFILPSNIGLWLNGERTIDRTFSRLLILRTDDFETEELREQAIEDFAKYLSRGRLKAIRKLREAGIQIFIVGETRIEGITKDKKYQDESLRRISRQKDQKDIRSHLDAQNHNPTPKQMSDYGFRGSRSLNEAKKRLLGGLEGKNSEGRNEP